MLPAPMRSGRSSSSYLVLVAAVLAGACTRPPHSTAVVLTIETNEVGRPNFLRLDWLGPGGVILRNERVPREDVLPPSGTFLATVIIEQSDFDIGVRRAFVHEDVLNKATPYWGVAEAKQEEGVWTEVNLLVQSGVFPDSDMDGVPDEIDRCKGDNGATVDDYKGCP